jgi:AraC-like DNA-binding protein
MPSLRDFKNRELILFLNDFPLTLLMHIQSYNPKNSLLQSCIECFYLLEHSASDLSDSFLILPSVNSYLSISLNTVTTTEQNVVLTSETESKLFDSSIQIGLKNPAIYQYRGKVKEICVRFKPLGVYAFFNQKALFLQQEKTFIPFDDYEMTMKAILKLSDALEIVEQLEQYFLKKHNAFTHPYLFVVLHDLQVLDMDKKINLDTLARQHHISRQTLNTQFKQFLNLSPSEFKQICRFRAFIQTKLENAHTARLTDILYDLGFFDQSHLIKYFRKQSLSNPLDFFKTINYSKENKVLLIWQ